MTKSVLLMYALTCLITFTNPVSARQVLLRQVTQVKVKKGLQNLVNTASISMPKNIVLPADKKLSDYFAVGDTVKIELGYNDSLATEFVGYIRKLNHDIPLIIECEDEMFILKQKTLKAKAFKKASLKDVLRYVLEGTGYKTEIIDTVVDDFVIESNVSVALVFQYLKQKLGITFSFKPDGTLLAGFPYSFKAQNTVYIADFQQNVAANSLEYRDKEDLNVKLIGVSHQKGKKPIKVIYNPNNALDKDSETRTINYNNLTEKELTDKLKEQYNRVQADGYKGSITLFGLPRVEPFEAIKLRDNNFADRQGLYLVNDIEVDFGVNGYRRTLQLGKKI